LRQIAVHMARQYYIVPASVHASQAQANPVRSTGPWRLADSIAGAFAFEMPALQVAI
jgi:hypothetical protein